MYVSAPLLRRACTTKEPHFNAFAYLQAAWFLKKSAAVWQQAIDALRLHDRSKCTLRAACFSCATNVKVAKN